MDNSDMAYDVQLCQVYGEAPAQEVLRALIREYSGYQFVIEQMESFTMWRRIYVVVGKQKMVQDLATNHTAAYNEMVGFAKGWLAKGSQ